jgi:predicted nucleic acid-binding protein
MSNQPDSHRIFIDTGAYYALVSPRDSHHAEALRIQRRMLQDRVRPFTTNFILAETHALILTRVGRDVGAEFLFNTDASPTTTIVRVTEADERRAREIIRQFSDKRFSLTDATSFAVMDRLQLTHAFAFDRNFEQYGKIVLRATP